jgi:hypothetical protein
MSDWDDIAYPGEGEYMDAAIDAHHCVQYVPTLVESLSSSMPLNMENIKCLPITA